MIPLFLQMPPTAVPAVFPLLTHLMTYSPLSDGQLFGKGVAKDSLLSVNARG